MKIAIIPARGGSKRVPRKNVRDFFGKPMIGWSIEAATRSKLFDHIIVSTDCPEVSSVAESFGASVPFRRPAHLSNDHATTREVMIHAIMELEMSFGKFEHACCIYATSPLLREEDLSRGFELLVSSGAEFAFSVTRFPHPIQRALRISSNDRVEVFYPTHRSSRSQDLELAYHDAGQFYWGRCEAFKANLPTFSPYSVPVIMPRYRVVDIDTEEDWQMAELMFKASQL